MAFWTTLQHRFGPRASSSGRSSAWRCHRIRDGRPNTAAQRKLYFVDRSSLVRLCRNPGFVDPDAAKLTQQ
jgi:hypothetical protein